MLKDLDSEDYREVLRGALISVRRGYYLVSISRNCGVKVANIA
jgi:hypothetical protein